MNVKNTEYELDARNLLCPMPIIRTQQKVKELSTGDKLTILCTDPGAEPDLRAWCRVHGHEFLEEQLEVREVQGEPTTLVIRLVVGDQS